MINPERPTTPILRFSPTAWAKLLFLRDYGETEVGGFGVTSEDDLLLIEDIQLVEQTATWAHVAFDDVSVADYFDRQVDAGRRPEQFARVWVHTHPGRCPLPSQTDEETFERVFANSDWALMFIIARGGDTYARLRYNNGPGAELELAVSVDYSRPFPGTDWKAWEVEYLDHVQEVEGPDLTQAVRKQPASVVEPVFGSPFDDDHRLCDELSLENDWNHEMSLEPTLEHSTNHP